MVLIDDLPRNLAEATILSLDPNARAITLRRRDGSLICLSVVDADDYQRQGKHRWSVMNVRGGNMRTAYAGRKLGKNKSSVLLHREVLGLGVGDKGQGDHLNRNRLDNRRCNLRTVTPAEQAQNVPSRAGSSKFRGVSYRPSENPSRPWKARVTLDLRPRHLGYFATEEEAAEAAASYRRANMPFATE